MALVEVDAVDDPLDRLVERARRRRRCSPPCRRARASAACRCPASCALDRLADLGRAGERDLVDARRARRARAPVRAVAGDDVDDAGRQLGLAAARRRRAAPSAASSRPASARPCCPHASAGAIFHASISSGKFHGMIWPATPSGRGAPVRERVLELVGPARVVEEVRGGEREVDVARLLDRLAAVQRLEHRELARALLEDARDPEQVLRALGRRERRTSRSRTRSRAASTASVDVLRPGLRDLGERLLGRGRDRRELRPRPRLDHLAADEEAVALLERDDVARLGRGRVLPRVGAATASLRVFSTARPSVDREVVAATGSARSAACGSASGRRSGATTRRSGSRSGVSHSAPSVSWSTHEVLDRLLRRADPAGRLHADHAARSRRRRRGSPRACRA